MGSVGLVLHHLRPEAVALACETVRWLTDGGHDVRVPQPDADVTGLTEWAVKDTDFARGLDVALVLGGDGTMLRTVHLVVAEGVPIIGVNVGHLGYLTKVEPVGLRDAMERFFAGEYEVEHRMTLAVSVDAPSGTVPSGPHAALNEAVLEKTDPGRTIRLGVTIGNRPWTTYAADGMIVATPTGSTAYALSARGPIISPRMRALLLTPVAPHMLFDRTLVEHPDETIRLEVLDGRPAVLSVDGQDVGHLSGGDAVVCRAGDHDARLVTFGGSDYHRVLKAKFGLTDR